MNAYNVLQTISAGSLCGENLQRGLLNPIDIAEFLRPPLYGFNLAQF